MHAAGDQVSLDEAEKVGVEEAIDDQVDAFFTSVPDLIDVNVFLADLEPCWDPNAVDRNVDGRDDASNAPLEVPNFAFVGDQESDTVDDNLKKELDLDHPYCYCSGQPESIQRLRPVHMEKKKAKLDFVSAVGRQARAMLTWVGFSYP